MVCILKARIPQDKLWCCPSTFKQYELCNMLQHIVYSEMYELPFVTFVHILSFCLLTSFKRSCFLKCCYNDSACSCTYFVLFIKHQTKNCELSLYTSIEIPNIMGEHSHTTRQIILELSFIDKALFECCI